MVSRRLTISRYAHLVKIDIELGDLTVVVGAQGAGKSLALPWLKTALDGGEIVRALKDAGQDSRPKTLVDLVFGVGMAASWRDGVSKGGIRSEVSLTRKRE